MGRSMVEVLVALIGTIGLIGVAMVQTMRRASSAADRAASTAETSADVMAERIGTPNGEGNVVQMLERILRGQTGQDSRLARLEERANHTVEVVGRLEHRLDELERRRN